MTRRFRIRPRSFIRRWTISAKQWRVRMGASVGAPSRSRCARAVIFGSTWTIEDGILPPGRARLSEWFTNPYPLTAAIGAFPPLARILLLFGHVGAHRQI